MSPYRLSVVVVGTLIVFTACSPIATENDDTSSTSPSVTSTEDRALPDPPAPVDLSTVDRVLSGDLTLTDGFEVPSGEVWAFDPARSTVVEVAANVVVRGKLVVRPSSNEVVHTLRFVDIDETRFVGGGVDPLPTDVGLWVVDDGVIDLQGTPKTPWSYEWQPEWEGDEVVATPYQEGDYEGFISIVGPESVPPVNTLGFVPELLNLTRNVQIEGTPEGRTHVFIRSTQPQTIRFVSIRYVAPDLQDPAVRNRDQDETGRYGIHFHHNGEGSRGSLVEGVVVRDAGNHAFVPHASHGITFRDTIAYNTLNTAYWWDPTSDRKPGNATNDTLYERAVAAMVRTTQGRDPAFQMGEGINNTIVGSVAVGVQTAGSDNSGFGWPGTEQGVWNFRDNLAHNNVAYGIFVWKNSRENDVIDGFTAYYNAKAGVSHGAYRNSFTYRDLLLLENDQRRGGLVAIESRAVGRSSSDGSTDMQLWDGVTTGGGVLRTSRHAQDPEAPVRFVDCDFSEIIVSEGPNHYSTYEFVDCGLTPSNITIEFMHPDSTLRSQDGDTAWEMTADGVARQIPPFVTP
jgi:hypothetical protein